MRLFRFVSFLFLLVPVLSSCDKSLNVNAGWKDVTVVYGILDQTRDTTYLKITKAYLGEGDALQFAKIPDSSTYIEPLEVRIDEYAGSTFLKSYPCDTVTIRNKEAGDSVFYYPDQLMYYSLVDLNETYTYKLFIRNLNTGKEVTAQTVLLHDFEIARPLAVASFPTGSPFQVKWESSRNGKRYQLTIRFFYQEALVAKPDSFYLKSIDWIVFNDMQAANVLSDEVYDRYFPSDAFYTVVGTKIDSSYLVSKRIAHHCDFIITVGAQDLNTYMEVTEPSLSLLQERPPFTNITNGIGLFSARYTKIAGPLNLSNLTIKELQDNPKTKHLGF